MTNHIEEDITLKFLNRDDIKKMAVKKFGQEHKVMLVCDFSAVMDDETLISYTKALSDTQVLNDEDMEKIISREVLLIVIPFYTLSIATELYRKIKHASHFVSIWADGKPYEVEC